MCSQLSQPGSDRGLPSKVTRHCSGGHARHRGRAGGYEGQPRQHQRRLLLHCQGWLSRRGSRLTHAFLLLVLALVCCRHPWHGRERRCGLASLLLLVSTWRWLGLQQPAPT
jgi:hypothetical protein